MRLVFMGTPGFAVPPLAALCAAGHEIVAAFAQPPRPAGRGHGVSRSPVHEWADARGIAVRTPATFKDPSVQAELAALDIDAAVVAAYGLILPKPVLYAPRLGCINIHASLLPRWRGAAPIQHAILAGDCETGVTIMQMDEGLDTGPILLAEAVPIGPDTDAGALHDTLAALGARLIVDALAGLAAGTLSPRPQAEERASYAPKNGRDEGRLDWTRPAAELERRVRAFTPSPGAWFVHDGMRMLVRAAEGAPGRPGAPPGTVLDSRLTVACGEGALRPLRVQRAGRAAMDAAAFLRGHAIAPGTVLA